MSLLGINAAELVVLAFVLLVVTTPKGAATLLNTIKQLAISLRQFSQQARENLDTTAVSQELHELNLPSWDPRPFIEEAVQAEVAAWKQQLSEESPSSVDSPLAEPPATAATPLPSAPTDWKHLPPPGYSHPENGDPHASLSHHRASDRRPDHLRIDETAANSEVDWPVSENPQERDAGTPGRRAS